MVLYSMQFSICSVIIIIATFTPKGAFAFNPKAIDGVRNEQELGDKDSMASSTKGDIHGSVHEEKGP